MDWQITAQRKGLSTRIFPRSPLLLPDDWQGVPPMLLLENEDEQN